MKVKIGAKLIGTFLLVSLFTLMVGITGMSTGSKLNLGAIAIADRLPKMENIGELKQAVADYRRYEVQVIMASLQADKKSITKYEGREQEALTAFNTNLNALDSSTKSTEGQVKVEAFKKTWEEYLVVSEQMSDLVSKNQVNEAIKVQREKSRPLSDKLLVNLKELDKFNKAQAQKDISSAATAYAMSRNVIIGITLISIILGLIIGWSVSKGISHGVKKVASTSIRVADGDLSVDKISIRTGDEIGELAESFNSMVEQMRNLIGEVLTSIGIVNNTAGQVSSESEQNSLAARQIALAIDELARGHNEQTTLVNEAVNVVGQMTRSIDAIAGGAQEQARNVTITSEQASNVATRVQEVVVRTTDVKNAAQQSLQAAQKGEASVEKAVEGMFKIQGAVSDSAEKITKLGQQSQQIGEIILVIDDIASQTNLLALNAAIEAARAGENGKGFAVVADEVRKLAERSGKATKEITTLITSIQSGTATAVKSMQTGTVEVEQGVKIVQEAGEAIREILEMVAKAGTGVEAIAQTINDIAVSADEVSSAAENVAAITEENTAATEQMASSTGIVNSSIESIAAISEESAAASQEVSAATEEMNASTEEIAHSAKELAQMAQNLQSLIARFKI